MLAITSFQRNKFNKAIEAREAKLGRELSPDELAQVQDLMNGKENLRPMPRSFNSSKQDFSAEKWGGLGTKISDSVNPDYLQNVADIQESVGSQLKSLLRSFKP